MDSKQPFALKGRLHRVTFSFSMQKKHGAVSRIHRLVTDSNCLLERFEINEGQRVGVSEVEMSCTGMIDSLLGLHSQLVKAQDAVPIKDAGFTPLDTAKQPGFTANFTVTESKAE